MPFRISIFTVPMMTLPFAFHTAVDTIPARLPYLSADPADVARWRDRVATRRRGL